MAEGKREDRRCLDDNELTAWIEARMQDAERDRIEEHLANCPDCRSRAGALVRDRREGTHKMVRAASGVGEWLAVHRKPVLTVVFLAMVVGVLLLARMRPDAGPFTDQALLARVEALAEEYPTLFEGFEPLARAERLGVEREVFRGGITLLGPTRTILSEEPCFEFLPVHGAAGYRISLYQGGRRLWSRECEASPCPYPAAAPGLQPAARYMWELEALGLPGDSVGSRAFRKADIREGEAFNETAAILGRLRPDPLGEILLAHWAIRHDLYLSAGKGLREILEREPDNQVVRETLYHVLVVLGDPEAEEYRLRSR